MSFSFSSTVSKSNPSEWASTSFATSMVWSDFGLSCLDYPLDRKNRDTVCTLLTDLPFEIVAVWVVGRPVNGYTNSTFEHWAVKIQAPPALISIDFLESKKKGAFGLQQTTATDAELEDFLHYFVRDENHNKHKKKWHIISSVTPSPLKNTSYLKYIDDHDLKKLKAFMQRNNNGQHSKPSSLELDTQLVKHINIKKKVCDIADFLGMWTETESHRKSLSSPSLSSPHATDFNAKSKKVEKTYNPITGNCQQFACDLFQYLVGHKAEYQEKVEFVQCQVQSPFDKKKYGVNNKRKVKKKRNSKSKLNRVLPMDDEKKQCDENQDVSANANANGNQQGVVEEEEEQQQGHMDDDVSTMARQKKKKQRGSEHKLNNPTSAVRVDSM
eukprot:CAMPEP_0197026290 /NCGR_PEP_ID=MMETSP1384-20130603/6411_1 /TAXON_ID=29189 /ORGANISM="Ammonia sp." /LENGTH=383 /DNA_ID=CAMNT_0042454933 /DNA_START=20 /DNA_END=1171 /DNA_ORIENTATION=+